MLTLREALNQLASHGNSAETGVLDRDTAQQLRSLLTLVTIFRGAAHDHIDRSGKLVRVDRNMSSQALDVLGALVVRLDEIDKVEVDSDVWYRDSNRVRGGK